MSKPDSIRNEGPTETAPTPPAPSPEWLAEQAARDRDALTEAAVLALLHNPRFEQIARLPVADPTRQGAGLYDYTRRLIDGYLTAQESAK